MLAMELIQTWPLMRTSSAGKLGQPSLPPELEVGLDLASIKGV
jgi:hypothetical protein